MNHRSSTNRAVFFPVLALLFLICVAGAASAFQQPQGGGAAAPAIVAAPKVTGPVANTSALKDSAHGYPFNATPMDLKKAGYVEEEFFIEGTANRYNLGQGGGRGAAAQPPQNATVQDSGHVYKTRVVVRRPASRGRFNGTAIVEWSNVSQGHDNEVDWFVSGEHMMRAGYAWIGVSAQGSAQPPNATGVSSLKEWSPGRYGTLDVSEGGTITGDALSFDIFTAAALAVRGKAGVDIMGGLRPEHLIATGHSQSAGRLAQYFNQIHMLNPVFDAAMIHGSNAQMRTDLNVKIFKMLSESDLNGPRQPDTSNVHTWEVAGTSHLDARVASGLGALGLRVAGAIPAEGRGLLQGTSISGGGPGIGTFQTDAATPNCTLPVLSRIPFHYVMNAAYDHLARWVKDGKTPPAGIPMEGTTATVPRDEFGNSKGGIRLAQHEVATALNTGQNSPPAAPQGAGGAPAGGGRGGGPNFCGLLGGHQPFEVARLSQLYSSHDAYVAAVRKKTEENVKAGFILKADADATIEDARRSNIGRK